MKRLILILCLGLVVMSCKKETIEPKQLNDVEYVNKEIKTYTGYIRATFSYDYTLNDSTYHQLGGDTLYLKLKTNDVLNVKYDYYYQDDNIDIYIDNIKYNPNIDIKMK